MSVGVVEKVKLVAGRTDTVQDIDNPGGAKTDIEVKDSHRLAGGFVFGPAADTGEVGRKTIRRRSAPTWNTCLEASRAGTSAPSIWMSVCKIALSQVSQGAIPPRPSGRSV